MDWAVTVLPEPDSPTRARVSFGLQRQVHAVDHLADLPSRAGSRRGDR